MVSSVAILPHKTQYEVAGHLITSWNSICRSSHPEMFLVKCVLKICSKFTGEQLCRSAISVKLQRNFIENTLRHGCSPVNLLHIFKTRFSKNTSEPLLLDMESWGVLLLCRTQYYFIECNTETVARICSEKMLSW